MLLLTFGLASEPVVIPVPYPDLASCRAALPAEKAYRSHLPEAIDVVAICVPGTRFQSQTKARIG